MPKRNADIGSASHSEEAGISPVKVGRKELLTQEVANAICKMIERMPDADIPVTWETISAHCQKRFGRAFNRQTLSQKKWANRKLIAEAYVTAKGVEAARHNDSAPKYRTASRAILQKRIADQEATILALREELETVRSHQLDVLDAFVNTRSELQSLIRKVQIREISS